MGGICRHIEGAYSHFEVSLGLEHGLNGAHHMGSTNHWESSGNALLGVFFLEHLLVRTRAAYFLPQGEPTSLMRTPETLNDCQ